MLIKYFSYLRNNKVSNIKIIYQREIKEKKLKIGHRCFNNIICSITIRFLL